MPSAFSKKGLLVATLTEAKLSSPSLLGAPQGCGLFRAILVSIRRVKFSIEELSVSMDASINPYFHAGFQRALGIGAWKLLGYGCSYKAAFCGYLA